MDQRTTTSPELAIEGKKGRGFVNRAVMYFLRPFISRLKRSYLLRKWAHHADPRSLDWEWDKMNFNRIAVVNLLLNNFDNPNYLEIGCGSDSLFKSVPISKKIGVDPFFGGNVRKTSDEFFINNDVRFDVIVIDGLHTYEQV